MANSLAWINASGGAVKNFIQTQDVYVYSSNSSVANITNVGGRAMIVIVNGFIGGTGHTLADLGTVTIADAVHNSYNPVVLCAHDSGSTITVYSLVYVTFGVVNGANTVTWSQSGGTPLLDRNIELIEVSGISSQDGTPIDGTHATLNGNITTNFVDCFFAGWFDEVTNNFTSFVLTPGSISSAVIHNGSTHFDHSDCWLNSASGFSSGTYTFTLNTTSTTRNWWVAAFT